MQHIKNVLKTALASLAYKVSQWKLSVEGKGKNAHVQYWQANQLGGGASIELGNVSRADAIKLVSNMNAGPIVFVDDSRGFIAFGNPPQSPNV